VRVQLPLAHRGRTLRRFLHPRLPTTDASSLTQDVINGATRARQSLALGQQVGIAGQIVQEGFGSRRPPQAVGGLIAHLENAVGHHLADALRGVFACTRLALQDGFILRRGFAQALDPFLDPALRHADRLGILLACPVGVLSSADDENWLVRRSILLP